MYISSGVRLKFKKVLLNFLSEGLFTLTNRVDPDEMPHHAAFHLGFHRLYKYSFRGFPYTKVIGLPVVVGIG